MSSSDLLRCHGYGCVGRERELNELTDAWDQDTKRIFAIYGSKGTGKSCVMRTFLHKLIRSKASDYRVIDIDFEDKKMTTGQFWKIIAKKLKIEIKTSTDEISGDILEEIEEMKVIFLLDNLDSTRNSDFFDDMQTTIIPEVMQTSCVRVFISARVNVHYAKKAAFLFPMEIKPLEIADADNLLLETTKKAKPEICWGPLRLAIAKLSEGVPLAIVITGSQLMQYNGLITPEDMVVLLIFGRMNTLSPDLYPKEDNMAQEYNDVIVKQSECIRERLKNISNMEKTQFSLEELIQHLPVKADSLENAKPFFKKDSVLPLLDRCLVSFDGKSQFEIPGLLKELLIIQQAIGHSSGINDRLMCIRAIDLCLQQVGIEIKTETLKDMIENPRRMEEIIQKIGKSVPRESHSNIESHEGSTMEKFKKLAVVHPHEPMCSQGQEPKLLSSYEQTMQNKRKDDSQMYHSSSNAEKANMQMQTWQADQKQRSEKQPSCMVSHVTKQHPYHMSGQNPEERSYGAPGQNSEQRQHSMTYSQSQSLQYHMHDQHHQSQYQLPVQQTEKSQYLMTGQLAQQRNYSFPDQKNKQQQYSVPDQWNMYGQSPQKSQHFMPGQLFLHPPYHDPIQQLPSQQLKNGQQNEQPQYVKQQQYSQPSRQSQQLQHSVPGNPTEQPQQHMLGQQTEWSLHHMPSQHPQQPQYLASHQQTEQPLYHIHSQQYQQQQYCVPGQEPLQSEYEVPGQQREQSRYSLTVQKPQHLPYCMPGQHPQHPPYDMPGQHPQHPPYCMPGQHPQHPPYDMPGQHPQHPPYDMPGQHPQHPPYDMPGQHPQHPPYDMPGQHPQHSPYDMPGQHPQHSPYDMPGQHLQQSEYSMPSQQIEQSKYRNSGQQPQHLQYSMPCQQMEQPQHIPGQQTMQRQYFMSSKLLQQPHLQMPYHMLGQETKESVDHIHDQQTEKQQYDVSGLQTGLPWNSMPDQQTQQSEYHMPNQQLKHNMPNQQPQLSQYLMPDQQTEELKNNISDQQLQQRQYNMPDQQTEQPQDNMPSQQIEHPESVEPGQYPQQRQCTIPQQQSQPRLYRVPGLQGEQQVRYKYNTSQPNWPESLEQSPKTISEAGFFITADGNFKCNYCGGTLHRSELDGKADPMEKHNKIDPNCPHVRLHQGYWAQDIDEEMARLQLGQSITGRGNAALILVTGNESTKGRGNVALTLVTGNESTTGRGNAALTLVTGNESTTGRGNAALTLVTGNASTTGRGNAVLTLVAGKASTLRQTDQESAGANDIVDRNLMADIGSLYQGPIQHQISNDDGYISTAASRSEEPIQDLIFPANQNQPSPKYSTKGQS